MRSLGLRARVFLGYLGISLFAASVCGLGYWSFHQLEQKILFLNERMIPALKTLGQIEGLYVILEQDIDRWLTDQSGRPKETDIKAIDIRLEWLGKTRGIENTSFKHLRDTFGILKSGLSKVLAQPRQSELDQLVSQYRSDFRHALRRAIYNLDSEVRLESNRMQKLISQKGIMVSALLILSMMLSVLWMYITFLAMRPLKVLMGAIKRISEEGVDADDPDLGRVASKRNDEFGVLAREFRRMLSSLRERTHQLAEQKINLERAHKAMAKQNSSLKQAQAKLQHQEKLALVGKLSAQIAHEIRNPLNAMHLHLDLLQLETRSEKAQESMRALTSAVDRLGRITDSYLSMARLPDADLRTIDLSALADEIRALYSPWLKQLNVNFEVAPMHGLCARADRQQLLQVVGNLIKNSVEAFPSVAPNKEIKLYIQKEALEDTLTLVCEDNGLGISEKNEADIFSPFFTTKSQGTGIGLAHSKQMIEAQGGQISFNRRQGGGTKFFIKLPMDGVADA